MTWIQQIPLFIRLIPAFTAGLFCVGVLVFLARHPVDGDQRVVESGLRFARPGIVFFAFSMFCMAPNWLVLGTFLIVTLATVHSGQALLVRLGAQLDHNTFV